MEAISRTTVTSGRDLGLESPTRPTMKLIGVFHIYQTSQEYGVTWNSESHRQEYEAIELACI